jgi:anti-anti-sigma regulatory factor
MAKKPSQIEVTVTGEAAIVRFRSAGCLMSSLDPRRDVGEDLFALADAKLCSVIVLDFENPDIHWLSGAFQALLVNLHHRLFKANGVLKLCNVPDPIMEQFQVNQLSKLFKIYPNLEGALKLDT